MERIAVVLSGGGAKGSFELGALDYLIRDHQADPEVFVGVSTGNLNAVMLAQGRGHDGLLQQLDALRKIWFDIDESDDVYNTRLGGIFGLLLKADSIYDNTPLWRLIKQHVDPEKLKTSGRALRVGVVGLKDAQYRAIDEKHPRIRKMIRASASIPVLFSPVNVGGERFVDGGVINVTPLKAAFDVLAKLEDNSRSSANGPDTVYIILASPTELSPITDDDELDSGIEIGKRALEIAVNEIYRNDLSLAFAINKTVDFYNQAKELCENLPGDFPFAKHRYVNLVLVRPDLFHMGSLEFDPDKIRTAFDDGRAKMREAIAYAETHNGTNITSETFADLIG